MNERERTSTDEPGRQPDQAEGERAGDTEHPAPSEARRTPGQAEGDRETVDAAIREHERKQS